MEALRQVARRPPDAARIAETYGRPDVAILPYASASLYPMAMGDSDDAAKAAATAAKTAKTAAAKKTAVTK